MDLKAPGYKQSQSLAGLHVVDLKKDFRNIGIQIILRLRHINLTPENPDYKGEDWQF